jgi:transporter family protein
MSFWVYALISAAAASATAILAKVGVEGVSSNLATAIRTVVILVFAWGIVAFRGEYRDLPAISMRSLVFLVLSGIATGVSWLAYFRALQLGPASRVAPIDKSSLALTVLLAGVLLKEPISLRVAAGSVFIVGGTLLMIR